VTAALKGSAVLPDEALPGWNADDRLDSESPFLQGLVVASNGLNVQDLQRNAVTADTSC
jgi:hypothetical protein